MGTYQGIEFEKLIIAVLSSAGYKIEKGCKGYDIRAEKDGKVYYIECKYSASSILSHMKNNKEKNEYTYIVPFKSEIEKFLISAWYCEKGIPDYKLWDLLDLQKILMNEGTQNTKNKEEIKSIFEKLNDFANKYYSTNLTILNRNIVQDLYNDYQSDSSKNKWKKFEKFTEKFVEFYFRGYIGRINSQLRTEYGIHRYDAIAPISIEKKDSYFLEIVINCFNCRYIVFEAKSYNKKISQSEIWRTSKYLHKAALRSVAIVVTNSKCDRHCKIVRYGLLREQGKLIIVLDGNDIREILEGPEDILENILKQKIDNLMTTLIA